MALKIRPDFALAHAAFGSTLVARGDSQRAVEACDALLARGVYESGVIAYKVLALNELGDCKGSVGLGGIDTLIKPEALSVPEGYSGAGEFHAALTAEALADPRLMESPPEQATRGGGQTGNLFTQTTGAFAQFQEMVEKQVARYVRTLPDDDSHPFIAYAPSERYLEGWAVFLKNEGHQIAHIHQTGWVSGVYYLKVPSCVSENDPKRRGWIEFGNPPEEYNCKADPNIRGLCPKEGMMVLFPSYVYHRTIPFDSPEERISVAFDVRVG